MTEEAFRRDPETGDVVETGDDAVDAALAALRAIDPDGAPGEHLPVLGDVHEALQQRLAAAAE